RGGGPEEERRPREARKLAEDETVRGRFRPARNVRETERQLSWVSARSGRPDPPAALSSDASEKGRTPGRPGTEFCSSSRAPARGLGAEEYLDADGSERKNQWGSARGGTARRASMVTRREE